MKPIRMLLASSALAVSAVLGGALPASAAGSYSVSDPGPTYVYTKGQWYNGGTLTAPTGVTGTISTMTWRYQTSYPIPTGHVEQLCDITWGNCIDVTSLGTGSTTAFSGRPVTDQFYFRFGVQGTGSVSPSYYFTNKSLSVSYN